MPGDIKLIAWSRSEVTEDDTSSHILYINAGTQPSKMWLQFNTIIYLFKLVGLLFVLFFFFSVVVVGFLLFLR